MSQSIWATLRSVPSQADAAVNVPQVAIAFRAVGEVFKALQDKLVDGVKCAKQYQLTTQQT